MRALKIPVLLLQLMLLVTASPASMSSQTNTGNEKDTQLIKDFQDLVNKYLEFRKNEVGSSPRPTKLSFKMSSISRKDVCGEMSRTS